MVLAGFAKRINEAPKDAKDLLCLLPVQEPGMIPGTSFRDQQEIEDCRKKVREVRTILGDNINVVEILTD